MGDVEVKRKTGALNAFADPIRERAYAAEPERIEAIIDAGNARMRPGRRRWRGCTRPGLEFAEAAATWRYGFRTANHKFKMVGNGDPPPDQPLVFRSGAC